MKIFSERIGARLSALIGFFFLVLVVLGALNWKSLDAETRDTATVIGLMQNQKMLGEVRMLMTENRGQIALALQHDPGSPFSALHNHPVTVHTDAVVRNRDRITALWNAYTRQALPEEEMHMAKAYQEARGRYVKDGLVPTMAAVLAGDFKQGYEVQVGKVGPFLNEALDVAGRLEDYYSRRADAAVEDSTATAAAAHMATLVAVVASILVAGLLGQMLVRSITRPLTRAVEVANAVAAGRLDNDIEVTARDETGSLLAALKQMQGRLQAMIGQTRAAAGSVAAAAAGLSAAAQQVSASVRSQAQTTAASAAAVEQLTVSIDQVAENADAATNQASDVAKLADGGSIAVEQATAEIMVVGEGVESTSSDIQSLSTEVGRIGNVTVVIKEVADQTNLLALNAAIEAARAGEQGRGFAVVADEVRKLAERTTNSVAEISTIIRAVQEQTLAAVESMQENRRLAGAVVGSSAGASGSMMQISCTIDSASRSIGEVSAALREQRAAAAELARNIESIAQASDRNATAVDDVLSTAMALEATASDLDAAIAQFRLAA